MHPMEMPGWQMRDNPPLSPQPSFPTAWSKRGQNMPGSLLMQMGNRNAGAHIGAPLRRSGLLVAAGKERGQGRYEAKRGMVARAGFLMPDNPPLSPQPSFPTAWSKRGQNMPEACLCRWETVMREHTLVLPYDAARRPFGGGRQGTGWL